MTRSIFHGKKILITGHTGFKGSWLTEWLLKLGATVFGLSLEPEPNQPLFYQLNLSPRLALDARADVRDLGQVREIIEQAKPDLIFHLAAQPIVRKSYLQPLDTFAINVLGSLNVLEAVRLIANDCAVIVITTDKCYENREWLYAYRECDALGGLDPYSASKACAELVCTSYRNIRAEDGSFPRIASARAGNVIGGGDWASDRIVPDAIRALRSKKPVQVRNRMATRPWQHVLEPLSGYLLLGAKLLMSGTDQEANERLCSAFNFGPDMRSNRTVADLVEEILTHRTGCWVDCSEPNAHHEASRLNLAIDKSFHVLNWQPTWGFEKSVAKTVEWYGGEEVGADVPQLTFGQIAEYEEDASLMRQAWTAHVLGLGLASNGKENSHAVGLRSLNAE